MIEEKAGGSGGESNKRRKKRIYEQRGFAVGSFFSMYPRLQ